MTRKRKLTLAIIAVVLAAAAVVWAQSLGQPGQPVPVAATMVGGSDGTNLRILKTAADGTLVTSAAAAATTPADATSNASIPGPQAFNMVFNGATWDRQRTATVFKTCTATASGSTACWTPAAGKKFRLMGYCLDVTANAAQSVAGVITIDLLDSAASTNNTWSTFIPGAAGTTLTASDQACNYSMGNGVLSAAANNVLNVNLSAALTAGLVRVRLWGTEE